MSLGESITGESALDGWEMVWAARTDVGKVRTSNEDDLLVRPGLFVVADGMGGHSGGEVAARIVVETFEEVSADVPLPPEHLIATIDEANRRVEFVAVNDHRHGMGSTLVVAALTRVGTETGWLVANVGDSRVYGVSADGDVRCLTRDQSVVQELIESDRIGEDDVATHPERSVITEVIGDAGRPDVMVIPTAFEHRLLLCSDGVSSAIDEPELTRILRTGDSPAATVDRIFSAVLAGRAHDNATAIVVDVVGARDVPTLSVPTSSEARADEVTPLRPIARFSLLVNDSVVHPITGPTVVGQRPQPVSDTEGGAIIQIVEDAAVAPTHMSLQIADRSLVMTNHAEDGRTVVCPALSDRQIVVGQGETRRLGSGDRVVIGATSIAVVEHGRPSAAADRLPGSHSEPGHNETGNNETGDHAAPVNETAESADERKNTWNTRSIAAAVIGGAVAAVLLVILIV